MSAASLWCNAWEQGELSDEVLADRVAELLESRNGARGFFVIGLASDCPLFDRLPDDLVLQLHKAGEGIVDLTVRNLAMSTAMAVHHARQSDSKQQARSERITARCTELLRLLEPKAVKERLERLLEGLTGDGDDALFIKRWKYDNEQITAIKSSLNAVAKN